MKCKHCGEFIIKDNNTMNYHRGACIPYIIYKTPYNTKMIIWWEKFYELQHDNIQKYDKIYQISNVCKNVSHNTEDEESHYDSFQVCECLNYWTVDDTELIFREVEDWKGNIYIFREKVLVIRLNTHVAIVISPVIHEHKHKQWFGVKS